MLVSIILKYLIMFIYDVWFRYVENLELLLYASDWYDEYTYNSSFEADKPTYCFLFVLRFPAHTSSC